MKFVFFAFLLHNLIFHSLVVYCLVNVSVCDFLCADVSETVDLPVWEHAFLLQ